MSGILGKKTENQKNVPVTGGVAFTLRKHSAKDPCAGFWPLTKSMNHLR